MIFLILAHPTVNSTCLSPPLSTTESEVAGTVEDKSLSTMSSTPQPPSLPPPSAPAVDEKAQFEDVQRKVSLGLNFACPLIAAVPPRKLDMYTFVLGGMWLWSINTTSRNYSGRSILQHIRRPPPLIQLSSSSVVGEATTNTRVGDETHEYQEMTEELQDRLGPNGRRPSSDQPKGQGSSDRRETMGTLERVWFGEEKDDKLNWRQRRLEKDREALSQGKGYGDLIMAQIREVWNGRGRRDDGSSGESSKGLKAVPKGEVVDVAKDPRSGNEHTPSSK